MFRILEAQAPAKQTATDTIATLCGRLQSATLLEDRRAAILGLRSFAKQFPASVSSGALRNLIDALRTQKDDPDTIKTVLDTLLMLFDPDPSSPEASEDIMMWMADEFSMKQENITALLDLLEQNEFFSRLYSLQLISAVSKARPERTQECVMTAPLGTTRLVSILDDSRDAVRTECLMLLTSLTPGNPEFQKQVVFESAFDRILRIIEQDGGLVDGGAVVQHGLELLANLLRLNSSNQMDFRETGGPKRVAKLLQPIAEPSPSVEGDQGGWNVEQRDRNLWGILSIIGLFLMDKGTGAQRNQAEFWKQGVTHLVVSIAFDHSMSARIQAKALITAADLIRRNTHLQEQFAQRFVVLDTEPKPLTDVHKTNGHKGPEPKNIIQALLDLSLNVTSSWDLEVRLAACECVKAYLQGHDQIRAFFLNRACEGHQSPESEPDNVLTIMLDIHGPDHLSDPYRQWMASVIFLHLFYDNHQLKKRAREVREGDEAAGEEVVTCIQTLTSNLVARLEREGDERISISYLMVLSSWLFEDLDAVNDLLQEGSNLQGLITIVLRNHHHQPIVAGLASYLLGIIYEFSTKDSPIPRSTVYSILISKLGRELFTTSLTRLREDPTIRDFEVEPVAEPLFDTTFVEFLKDNFSRIIRAIDREPDLEVSVNIGGVEKGVSREQVDSLRAQLEEYNKSLDEATETIQSLERQLAQEQAGHRRSREGGEVELRRITAINAELQRNHEAELQRLKAAQQQFENDSRSRHAMEVKTIRDQMTQAQRTQDARFKEVQDYAEKTRRAHEVELKSSREAAQSAEQEMTSRYENQLRNIHADATENSAKERDRHEAEAKDLRTRLEKAEKSLIKTEKDHARDLKTAYDEHTEAKTSLEGRLKRAEERLAEAEKREKDARKDAKENEEARAAAQTELDDLLIVLGDLEEKRSKDKAKLKELGQEVSDDDDDDEDDDNEEEEEDID